MGSGFFVLGAAWVASRTRKADKILKSPSAPDTLSRRQAERAVKLHPQNPQAHVGLATVLAQDSDPGVALASLELALRLRPADAAAAAAFLRVAGAGIMPADAILQAMENVAYGAPDVARIWILAARAAHQAGRYDRAELYALRALERAPWLKFAHQKLAAAQDAARRRDDARRTRAFLHLL
jgi:tetratricopeptide (TPR) repeat protein